MPEETKRLIDEDTGNKKAWTNALEHTGETAKVCYVLKKKNTFYLYQHDFVESVKQLINFISWGTSVFIVL